MTQTSLESAIPSPKSGVAIQRVHFDAPWDWLAAGWRDMWRVPQISLSYGAVFALLAFVLAYGLMQLGWLSLFLVLCGGFVLVGPLFAVGLYEISRRLERGEPVSFRDAVTDGKNAPGQVSFFGAVLGFAFFVWLELAFLLFMLFMGTNDFPPMSEFVQTLLFTPHGLGLLSVGTLVGGCLAMAVFSIAAISMPLLLSRRIDVVTAMSASYEAVLSNPKPMLLWAAIIVGCMILGIVTLFVGLIFAFPLIGHASWHAYRNLVANSAPA